MVGLKEFLNERNLYNYLYGLGTNSSTIALYVGGGAMKKKTKERLIHYRYYHWGPYLASYQLEEKELRTIEALFNKDKRRSYRTKLAGHVDDEYALDIKKTFKVIAPYINSYCRGYIDFTGQKLCDKFKMVSAWVNYMKRHEFNPPHNHAADLSCVLFTQVPEELIEENKNHESRGCGKGKLTGQGPGGISFSTTYTTDKYNIQSRCFFPVRGNLFVFPASLVHWVYPFQKAAGERISVSGNFTVWSLKKGAR
tara:strand:+ start:3064 stop:3822 length:759 start_codon:yes stop_codon:yes gene_type:complete